ncbi:DNA translocase FtsK [Proteiniborus sp. MB09-C3]|uniref:FtsK/SpoIIIE family DNA translocase n=1 Tax=Proteiniborus sp. MB09-C3 TaxID=3050072 RepID=UPI002552404A|nr:DNA translocase FtsK [Proteiniborus sp. MB09-C3]WIV10914.1 DNA translocase FtsK [Proteiniborus sp. MB09-C3]
MTKAKGRVATKNRVKTKRNIKMEIAGILIIAIGLLSLLSMYNKSTGFIGEVIRKYSILIAGLGGYVFPTIVLLLGFLFITNKIEHIKKTISIIIAYIGFLTIVDINFFPFVEGLSFIDRVKLSIDVNNSVITSEKLATGGGIIGSSFSYIFLSLFGTIGSYVVIIAMVLISFLLFTDISVIDMLRGICKRTAALIKTGLKNIMGFVYIEDNGKKNSNKNDKKDSVILKNIIRENEDASTNDIITVSNEVDSKIRVLDYTKVTEESMKTTEKNRDEILEKEDMNINISEGQKQENYEDYKLPYTELLKEIKTNVKSIEKKEVLLNANKLIDTLNNFGIEAKILQVSIGPSITRYEIQPAPGVKVSKIVSLTNDIALSLASSDIRMEAPIPGKSAIGIEVPNKNKVGVGLKEILESKEYNELDTRIPFALGKDIAGKPMVANIEKMPHLLIAGATGSGKSVCINTLITSILFKAKPDEVKLMLIDPKVVELSVYNGVPHLLVPVVTDPKKAAFSLNWAVQEMTRRYNLFAKNSVRDLDSYNNKAEDNIEMEKLPKLVIIIDELADLMMVSASEVEDYICRLAQMARAAGIHLIVATQRPSVDIITGTIKANIPSRISFAVSSQADSRTILDMGGAEKLLGKGDMLFYPVGESKPVRIQGAFISEEEINGLVEYLKGQCSAQYEEKIIGEINNNFKQSTSESDELLPNAIDIVIDEGQASISLLQRRLKIGYARAARIIDEMEERGVVGGYEGSKPRKVLITKEDYEND